MNSHKPLGGVPGGLASNGMGGLGVSVGGLGSAGAIGSSPSGMGSSSIADLSQRQTSTSVFSAYVDLKPPVSESKTVGQQVSPIKRTPSVVCIEVLHKIIVRGLFRRMRLVISLAMFCDMVLFLLSTTTEFVMQQGFVK